PLHPSKHRVQIPDDGATDLERFTVPVASFAFGCLRFMNKTPNKLHILRSEQTRFEMISTYMI
ncbi:MAG TPA: hypothetical protein VFG36_04060, partial [Methanoregula sp.]|nr:hypothetical protein [Methanoregula sp.]